jgi:ankyrin repeat protein
VFGGPTDLAAVISRQLVLPLMLAASLISANAFGGTTGSVQDGDAASTIADFFDGLRAWELKEKPTAAAIWLRAAEWGDVRSMEKIGELYDRGEVLPHDTTLAYFWFSQAAQRGAASAKAAADRLRNQLPADHLSEVDASVASWRPESLAKAAVPEEKPDVGDLLAALNDRDIQRFRAVLSSGVSASSLDPGGVPVILLAIATKDINFVRALLDKRADRHARLPNGMTPLHLAAGLGDQGIVKMLIAEGFPSAVQDENGVWPFDLAEKKKSADIAAVLRRQWELDIKDFRSFLEQRGYIAPNKFSDPAAREQAVKMFQKSAYIKNTGYIDPETYANAEYELTNKTPVPYAIVYRYELGNEILANDEAGDYTTADAARASAMEFCRKTFNNACKIDLVPSGGCLSGFRRTGVPSMGVSRKTLSESDAQADALAQCTGERSKGCSIGPVVCAPPLGR